ncbi:MAG: fatty acid CoA ligase family protein [Thermoguttaceae bacterium]
MPHNIATLLTDRAREMPDAVAIAEARRGGGYRTITFAELDADSNAIANAMRSQGLVPGMRVALLVRYSIDFVSIVFGLFKSGAVIVLIDPGMGFRQMLKNLEEMRPDGFAAVSAVHAVRILTRRFPQAKYNLTVGGRWFWGGASLAEIRKRGDNSITKDNTTEDAAIIFTSGSTGPAKGVRYTHKMFAAQVAAIQSRFGIEPGGVDLAAFPFFGLFNAAMGTTTIIPEFDSTRPADADPRKIVAAANDWHITQSFASPALWRRVAEFCRESGASIPTLRRCIAAGAPIPVSLLEKLRPCIASDGEIFTPYGATEALPVSVISASEVLNETAEATRRGDGICVGTRFAGTDWRVIAITDAPLEWSQIRVLPCGEIGELVVCGEQVTREYVARPDANALAKIVDDSGNVWHRMGDVGWLDERERFWFCGRKNHRVVTQTQTLFSIPCEAIFLQDKRVARAALVGIGQRGTQTPAIWIEPQNGSFPQTPAAVRDFEAELRTLAKSSPLTATIEKFFFAKSFPVDVRHNAKINRELLAMRSR